MADFTMTWCAAPKDGEKDWLPEWEQYVDALDDDALLALAISADPFLDADDDADLAEFGHKFDGTEFRQSLLDAGQELLRRGRGRHREVLWLPGGIEGGGPVFVSGGMSAGDFSTGDGFDFIHLVSAAERIRRLPWAPAPDPA